MGKALPPRSNLVYLVLCLLLVAALALVAAWGARQRSEALRLADDQRLIALWLSNPRVRLTPLQPEAGDAGRLGVVARLPDGRAVILQPTLPGPGAEYVVTGWGPGGLREIARSQRRFVPFSAEGLEVVELRVANGDEVTILGAAHLE